MTFDIVLNHLLPMKINMYGITGKTHRWLKDFLGNRSQEVIVNGSKCESRMVKSCVQKCTVF